MPEFSPYDLAGLVGVAIMLVAYGFTVAGRLAPSAPPALLANLIGACLVLVSLSEDFNLSAAVIEGAWAVVALGGLVRWAWLRR